MERRYIFRCFQFLGYEKESMFRYPMEQKESRSEGKTQNTIDRSKASLFLSLSRERENRERSWTKSVWRIGYNLEEEEQGGVLCNRGFLGEGTGVIARHRVGGNRWPREKWKVRLFQGWRRAGHLRRQRSPSTGKGVGGRFSSVSLSLSRALTLRAPTIRCMIFIYVWSFLNIASQIALPKLFDRTIFRVSPSSSFYI